MSKKDLTNNLGLADKTSKILLAAVFLTGTWFFADGLWIKGKAAIAQVMLDRAFLNAADEHQKPWAWADISPIAKVSAPRLQQSNIVLNNTSGEALAFGPGHLADTPLPGERGTAVFSAHRDTHFRWIGELRKGDEIIVIRKDGKTVAYEVRRAWIAKADSSGINADSDEHLIALTTCWPLDGTQRSDWRYIVEGVEVGIQDPEIGSI